MPDFKGFDDWIEVFRGGQQTDSAGRTRTWTAADLDQIVANHNAEDPVPAVIGHPKTDDPAYAWVDQLKRVGDKLVAKFREVEPQFEEMVKAGRFKKRSVSIAKNKAGELVLRHVGWLGAKAPAVEGLAHPTFSDDGAEVFEFQVDWRTPGFVKRVVRGMRELAISQFGIEIADKFFPEHMIDEAEFLVDDAKREPDPDDPDFAASFSHDNFSHDNGDSPVPQRNHNGNSPNGDHHTFTQADIDAAVQAERDRLQGDLDKERRERRLQEFRQYVDELNAPPAITAGMAEFMAELADADDAQFEFAADDKQTKKQTPLAWFQALAGQLKGKFDHLFDEQGAGDGDARPAPSTYDAPAGYTTDPDALKIHDKAMEYMRNNSGVEYVQAVQIVEREGA